jgi:hypothetical protein
MKTLRRLVALILAALTQLLGACAANVRYHDRTKTFTLEVQPADHAADLIE